MNSLEKLDQALAGAEGVQPEDEQTARMLQMLGMAKPMLSALIPDTPEELDAQLLGIVRWLLSLYSDTDDPAITDCLSGALAELEILHEYKVEGVA
ncbi:MAG TPA: hypothetical protein VFI17_03470 [Solirubrobacterales bacterium]|nr:hypothetical protein [Solirubrobacterales bacterium]